MPASELRVAVNSVVDLLRKTQVQQVISHFRTDLVRNQVTQSRDHLHAASQQLLSGFARLGATERRICAYMHLEDLGSPQYWSDILNTTKGIEVTRAEVVQLYSRVMFAVNHLPGLVQMLGAETSSLTPSARPGHALLKIKLVDAGERASDPDRISRTIDGIDMVYSACVSIANKPVADLALISIEGDNIKHIVFEGDVDGINAVREVIDSMVEEISEIENPEDFDPDLLVSDLPVFDDLQTLQNLGKFKADEAKDIAESMHEGCLLVMESGVMLEPKPSTESRVVALPVERSQTHAPQPVRQVQSNVAQVSSAQVSAMTSDVLPTVTLKPQAPVSAAPKQAQVRAATPPPAAVHQDENDMSPLEFYEQYLKEKNRMKDDLSNSTQGVEQSSQMLGAVGGEQKTDALNELIQDLDRVTRK